MKNPFRYIPAKIVCAAFIILFICFSTTHAQQGPSYGRIIYDPIGTMHKLPLTIRSLIPGFPIHDSIIYAVVLIGKGEDCMTRNYSDSLGSCFRELMYAPRPGNGLIISDCSYFLNGVKSSLPDKHFWIDNKLRLCEGLTH
jgi:hypothetical protein